jgi:hypothetical protein
MTIDVIMLSYTKSQREYNMTAGAIRSLRESEDNYTFNIILLETNPFKELDYDANLILCPNEPFNYNRFLNKGLELCNNEYVVFSNNDLSYEKLWATNIIKNIEEHNLDSATPCSPNWTNHTIISHTDNIQYGYGVGGSFCGWCIFWKRSSLNKILPLDEQFIFWCQDNDLAIICSKMGFNHALVGNSIVNHLFTQSLSLVSQEDWHAMVDGCASKLNNKINSGGYDKWG